MASEVDKSGRRDVASEPSRQKRMAGGQGQQSAPASHKTRPLTKSLKSIATKWKLAFQGIGLAAREWHFWLTFVLVFLVFGVLLNLLSSGTAGLNLLFRTGFSGFLHFVGKALLATFGVGRNFWDFLLTFLLIALQATLISTIVVVAKHAKDDKIITAEEAETNRAGAQRSGLVAGLAILGSGCPTCGTALITPILGMIFSTGGMALAGLISGVITAAAIVVAIFSLRAAGIDAYAAILKVCPNVKRRKNLSKGHRDGYKPTRNNPETAKNALASTPIDSKDQIKAKEQNGKNR